MSGRGLMDVPMLECLPLRLRQDPDMIALCKTTDILLALVHAQIRYIRIWSRIDELEEPLLSVLAHQMHLEGYEGWHLAETVEQKRRLLKDAYKTHFYKGTRWSLERVFDLLDLPGKVAEWWEQPADDFPPYTFDMDFSADSRPLSPSFCYDAMGLIDALKNLRSHLRYGSVSIKAPEAPVCVGAMTIVHVTARVEPLRASRITVRDVKPFVGAGCHATAAIRINPITQG